MKYHLKIDIQSYWHSGTGSGRGADVDALTHRNHQRMPSLPGRSLKGLLRDAVTRWELLSGEHPNLAEALFGSPADAEVSSAGCLRISDANLPHEEAAYLAENQDLLIGLYRNLYSTAIAHGTGVAVDQSLRGMEVVVPLTLYAEVELILGVGEVEQWADKIRPALSLIQAVGSNRTRGLGRAVVTLEEVKV